MSGNTTEILQVPNGDQDASVDDFHAYSKMKSYAKGLVDFALISANASQLRYALAIENGSLRIFNVFLISLSIVLQVTVYLIFREICVFLFSFIFQAR